MREPGPCGSTGLPPTVPDAVRLLPVSSRTNIPSTGVRPVCAWLLVTQSPNVTASSRIRRRCGEVLLIQVSPFQESQTLDVLDSHARRSRVTRPHASHSQRSGGSDGSFPSMQGIALKYS